MKRNFIYTLLLLICINQVKAQQEFFGKTNGLTLSGGTGFNNKNLAGVDLYLKDNLILSGSLANYMGVTLWGAGVNFLVTGANEDSSTKGIVGLSYTSAPNLITIYGVNAGILQMVCKESNFPLSLSAIANISLSGLKAVSPYTDNSQRITINPIISYTQAFFAHEQVYPVLGVSYQMILDPDNNPDNENPLFVFVGLNIKLEKTKNK